MLTYVQRTGGLFKLGKKVTTGYSGHGEGRNNPDMQSVHNVGPIPCGIYDIGPLHHSDRVGDKAMCLTPEPGTNVFGRTDFLCHGDTTTHDASHGCVIMGLFIRTQIVDAEPDRKLKVVAEESDVTN